MNPILETTAEAEGTRTRPAGTPADCLYKAATIVAALLVLFTVALA